MTTHAADAARAYFAAVGTADVEGLKRLFADDARLADPVGAPVLEGHAGVERFHKMTSRAWASLAMTPTSVVARGDRAAAAWTARGRSASGNDIAFEGINVFRVDAEGRIAELEGFWDFEGVIAQM